MEQRLINEIEHGRFLAPSGAGEIWNWTSPAGVLRWRRRAAMLCRGLQPGERTPGLRKIAGSLFIQACKAA